MGCGVLQTVEQIAATRARGGRVIAVGTTVSVALRNTITGIGGIASMFALAPKLAGMMLLGIPIAVAMAPDMVRRKFITPAADATSLSSTAPSAGSHSRPKRSSVR